MSYDDYLRGWNEAIDNAAMKAESWGNECAGGSGGEIIKDGPNKGQRYGEGYYNLASSIMNLRKGDRRKAERRSNSV